MRYGAITKTADTGHLLQWPTRKGSEKTAIKDEFIFCEPSAAIFA
jgi:hypothetical protein